MGISITHLSPSPDGLLNSRAVSKYLSCSSLLKSTSSVAIWSKSMHRRPVSALTALLDLMSNSPLKVA